MAEAYIFIIKTTSEVVMERLMALPESRDRTDLIDIFQNFIENVYNPDDFKVVLANVLRFVDSLNIFNQISGDVNRGNDGGNNNPDGNNNRMEIIDKVIIGRMEIIDKVIIIEIITEEG